MPQRKEFYERLAAHSDRVVAGANATLRLIAGLGNPNRDRAQKVRRQCEVMRQAVTQLFKLENAYSGTCA
jgi:hypothetical protein